MRCVITGGAGFLGSHLADLIIQQGHEVLVLDSLHTGSRANICHLLPHPAFTFRECDVRYPLQVDGPVDIVFHLASPASPPVFTAQRVDCLLTNSLGVYHAARLALDSGARLVQASTSEVYGDPLHHPQVEGDWGNVNPIGERSCYDEGKRYGEALITAMRLEHGLNSGIARIFNTYGPRMHPHDGRVISGFVRQALAGEPLTVFGNGSQTRSFCYVSDLVRGLWLLGNSDHPGPVNLGNPLEHSVLDMAHYIRRLTGSSSPIVHEPLPGDDPARRRPQIARAKEVLGWEPVVGLEEGMSQVIAWQRQVLAASKLPA
ncbi:UDP-glucuronic acid decarboxylase family protein [Corynebacterium nasicanis]|uniref:UDP-glucuronic acid decarboxylase family protein n=1 Tax=Corynebacterium nasicanis TaxID=1448267 RepID=A0ABW1QFT7_9CORY